MAVALAATADMILEVMATIGLFLTYGRRQMETLVIYSVQRPLLMMGRGILLLANLRVLKLSLIPMVWRGVRLRGIILLLRMRNSFKSGQELGSAPVILVASSTTSVSIIAHYHRQKFRRSTPPSIRIAHHLLGMSIRSQPLRRCRERQLRPSIKAG